MVVIGRGSSILQLSTPHTRPLTTRRKYASHPSSASEDDGRARRLGSARHDQLRAADPHRRQAHAARHAAAHRAGDEAARLLRAHRRAEAPLRGEPRARPLLRHQRAGPLPREHLQPARRHGRRLPPDSLRDPRIPELGLADGRRRDLQQVRAVSCSSPARPARANRPRSRR